MANLLRQTLAYRQRNILIRFYNKIVITDDGTTIVALHKEQGFPYEHSRPLPEVTVDSDTNVLKMSDFQEAKRVFGNIKPEIARKHLATVTLTTEHRWFPRARDKKAKKNEMNRPYL